MIAEIYGKISLTGSNLSDRLEDQLTGDVFGTLRYIDPAIGLIPILSSCYFIDGNEQDGGEQKLECLIKATIEHIIFWPWLMEAEPDVLIEMIDANNRQTLIVIEVKYSSGLSSDDNQSINYNDKTDSQGDKVDISRNQLIRQMRGMKDKYP